MRELGFFEDHTGPQGAPVPVDPIEAVAREKGVSSEGLKAYGAEPKDGKVVLPMYGPDGEQCSRFTLSPAGGKGLCEKNKPAGLFLPGRRPQPGETWYVAEGVKDAAALHAAFGYLTAGMPANTLSVKFATLFYEVNVVMVPDRDEGDDAG